MTITRVCVASSGRPHHRPTESPIYVQYISLTCLLAARHATTHTSIRSSPVVRDWPDTCLQTSHQVFGCRTEYS